MIGSLRGTIDAIIPPHMIIDVSGVGYKVLVSFDLLEKYHIGDTIKVYTHTHVLEDALELFGFLHPLDLGLFGKLISVSGVGPKTAMAIFSNGSREEIMRAIIAADVAFFTAVPRLGKKNAQKIIIELKERLGSLQELDLSGESIQENSDVIEALKHFGFTSQEVQKALKALHGQGTTTEEKIKLAIKQLGK